MKKEVTTTFNIVATVAVLLVIGIFDLLFEEVASTSSKRYIDLWFDSSLAKIFAMTIMYIVLLFTLTSVFKEVWNRLISDIVNLREINFNEAYSLCILLIIVVSSA